ncbi:MAG TPA: TRAP transporter large permease subunit, partial [Reyranella sp.]
MPPSIIAILILGLLFVLLAGGMPLGFAMGLSGFLGTLLLIDIDAALALLGQTAYETGLAYNLSVIPLFVLMGYIAGEAGLNQSLYSACNAWLGHRRGGLALATIGACGAFAAICGSSLATAATMAQIALPEMRKYKYDDRLATGAVAAGGTIGILIPPSVVMVIYGLLTETSISALFLAGFVPGFLTVLGFMATISIMTRIDPKLGPPAARTAMPDRFKALGSVWGTALLFLVVIGGLYVGWFSPTEAASVGTCGAFVLGLINRKTPRQLLGTSLIDTVKTTAMIFTVLIGAILFNNFLILASVPNLVSGWISGLPLGK